MCTCSGTDYMIIGQILNENKRKPTNIYFCPKCKTSYIKAGKGYKRLTPYYFLTEV